MLNDVVGLFNEFVVGEFVDFDKFVVVVGNDVFEVGGCN